MQEMRTPRPPLGSSHPSFLLTGLEPVLSLGTRSRRKAFRLGHLALRASLGDTVPGGGGGRGARSPCPGLEGGPGAVPLQRATELCEHNRLPCCLCWAPVPSPACPVTRSFLKPQLSSSPRLWGAAAIIPHVTEPSQGESTRLGCLETQRHRGPGGSGKVSRGSSESHPLSPCRADQA